MDNLYQSKYYKYKKKYLTLKGGSKANSTFPIMIKLNMQDNVSTIGNITANVSNLNETLRDFLPTKMDPRIINMIEKYINDDDKSVLVNGNKSTDLLDRELNNFLPKNSISILLKNESESEEIKEFKAKLENISNTNNKNLVYISLASFLNTIDNLEYIIHQQFLPNELISLGLIPQFSNIFIFLIDGGFKNNQDSQKQNLITQKDKVFQELNLEGVKDKFIIEIIGSHVPNMGKFLLELSSYVKNKTVIYASTAGNDVIEIPPKS
ncbi:hypothetical protein CPAV1605_248 [seawater metagenome]|uniref:Uncharacterized protein n=1 Tax=seawater metagenome TaxID=1561972 RepID=A0A5E8CGH1_9ZZZZ